jgi:pimeloyl-ACP methyl ester carboxylesterase
MQPEACRDLQQETTIDGLKVSHVDHGQGPALLWIHGIAVWSYLWKDCIKPLSKQFRLIVPDLVVAGHVRVGRWPGWSSRSLARGWPRP